MGRHRVVVVGGGFGGLQAVLKLRRAPVEVTLVDRRNFHLFQPLTYQVATGALSAGEITYPLRGIFKRDRNVRVVLADVTNFDLEARELHLRSVSAVPVTRRLGYDTLVVAGGSHYSYFGHDEWRAGIRSRRAGVGSSSRSSGRSRKPTDAPSRHRIITSGLIHSASSRTSLGPCSAERSSVRAVTGKSTTDRRPAATSAA
jgi:hypothetical protein